jgi:hypothetical protein
MLLQFIYRFISSVVSKKSWYRLAVLAVVLGCQQAILLPARSQTSKSEGNTATTAPAALTTILTKIDAAASQRQLPELLRYYSPNFSTSDGLNKAAWQQSLNKFWQSYNNLKYTTTLENWKSQENGYTARTTTKIIGIQNLNGRTQNLLATIQSRQKIVGGQIVQQQILQERTQISSGTKPPTIEINLPERLQTNAEYTLDAIVTEPLGEDVLMGTTVEQAVSAQGYDLQPKYKLELLTAGGLFKVARAPGKSGDYWVSTMFIRPSGMTTLTQRVHVVRGK